MSLIFLRKLSVHRGHAYLSEPEAINGVVQLKLAGWIDAEVGPYVKDANLLKPPTPPLFAIVRGLTPEGWKQLDLLDRRDAAHTSKWNQAVNFTKRKLLQQKFGAEQHLV